MYHYLHWHTCYYYSAPRRIYTQTLDGSLVPRVVLSQESTQVLSSEAIEKVQKKNRYLADLGAVIWCHLKGR